MYVHEYTYIHRERDREMCMYACMCVCIYVYIYICVYVCMYTYIHIYICMYVHIYVHNIYIYILCDERLRVAGGAAGVRVSEKHVVLLFCFK